MVSTLRVGCYERLKPATGIFSVNISLSADTRGKCCEVLSNDEK